MAIEQTIEIPANGWVHLDLPPEMAGTSGKVVVTAPVATPEAKNIPLRQVSLLDLRGSCKGADTMEAYFARKRADKAKEDENDLWQRGVRRSAGESWQR
jgi:hypothetical protein